MSDRKYTFRFTMEATIDNMHAETENEAEQVLENLLSCWARFIKSSGGPLSTLTDMDDIEFKGYK